MKSKPFTVCAICGVPFLGYGHNPAPVARSGRCCSCCNDVHVITARLVSIGLDRLFSKPPTEGDQNVNE